MLSPTSGGAVRAMAVKPQPCNAVAASLDARLWEGVNRLLDRAVSLDGVRSHDLELLALARWRELGRPIPNDLAAEGQAAAMKALAAPLLLQRVRESCDGPIVLLKGPETAACYPRPSLRSYNDLDILVPDAVTVQRSLIKAGFIQFGDERAYLGSHQMSPLRHPGCPLLVEVHARPHWVAAIPPPSVHELFETAVESVVPVSGISALPRTHHTVLLAAHAWAHEPLGNLRHLIDIAAARQGVATPEAEALATAWGIERIWRTTVAALDALLFGTRRSWPLRVWARNLDEVREHTVFENHLRRWFAGFSVFPPGPAVFMAARAVRMDLGPFAGEGWPAKLRRIHRAARNALVPLSRHDTELESMLVGGRLSREEGGRPLALRSSRPDRCSP